MTKTKTTKFAQNLTEGKVRLWQAVMTFEWLSDPHKHSFGVWIHDTASVHDVCAVFSTVSHQVQLKSNTWYT